MKNQNLEYLRRSPQSAQTEEMPPAKRWALLLATPFVWFMPAVVFIIVVSILCGIFLIPLGLIVGPIVAIVLLFVINRWLNRRRRQRSMIVLGYLENAARLNLPLAQFLSAAEKSETGVLCRYLHHLRENLSRGYSVSAALGGSVPGISQEILANLQAAELNGQLQSTLTLLLDEESRQIDRESEDSAFFLRFYPIGVGGTLFLILLFFMVFVVPKFQEIFKDFRTDLPLLTQYVMNISSFLIDDSWLTVILVVLLALLITTFIGYHLQQFFTPWWPVPSMRSLIDTISWRTPFWHQLQRDRGMAGACAVLDQATRCGRTLPEALDQASSLPANAHFQRRMALWKSHIERGKPAAEAARLAQMPEILVGFLQSGLTQKASSEPEAQSDMFAFLARYYRNRLARTVIALRAAAEPAMVFVMGSLVGTFIVAMFLPLVKLINSVSGTDPGGPL